MKKYEVNMKEGHDAEMRELRKEVEEKKRTLEVFIEKKKRKGWPTALFFFFFFLIGTPPAPKKKKNLTRTHRQEESEKVRKKCIFILAKAGDWTTLEGRAHYERK